MLYVGVSFVVVGMVKYTDIDEGAPIADAFDQVGLGWASALVSLAAVAGLTSVILVDLVTVSRIGFAMGRDGLLPPAIAKVSPRTGTPVRMTLAYAAVVLVMAAFVPLAALADLVSIGTLFAFVLVSAAVPVLRRTRPELKRPFRVPFSPVVPILSAVACLYLMANLSVETWIRFLVWLVVGLLVYAGYGYRHSRVGAAAAEEARCTRRHRGPVTLPSSGARGSDLRGPGQGYSVTTVTTDGSTLSDGQGLRVAGGGGRRHPRRRHARGRRARALRRADRPDRRPPRAGRPQPHHDLQQLRRRRPGARRPALRRADRRTISSFVGGNKELARLYLTGELDVELTPQGTLAERLRAGGAGIPAFYTPTGVGTMVAEGGIPIRYDADGNVVKTSEPKEVRVFDGQQYVLETALTADFALVRAAVGDRHGNMVFHESAGNFNRPAGMAGRITIAEVEELVEPGEIRPEHVHLPGVFVDRVVVVGPEGKKIEKRTTRPRTERGREA